MADSETGLGGTEPGPADPAASEPGETKRKRKRKSRERDETPPPAPEPLPAPVGDSHTHLDMQEPAAADIIAAADAVNVRRLVQVGVDVPSSRTAVELAAAFERVHAAVALHPNEAPRLVLGDPDGWSGQHRAPGGAAALEEALAEIDKLAADEQVLGIGETGLDYFRTGPEGAQAQQDSFRAHIAIAKRHGKALVIHDRDAHEDVLRILVEEGSPETVVFHCYSGDAAMAKVCAERGYYMSFAGNLTYKANQALQEAFQVAPIDRVLVETDAPFLTPLPYRGRPNAPYLVPYTVRAMAALRGMDSVTGLAELCQALDSNLRDAFQVRA
ncbi:hydrolase, TatD family [Catenulispora acidiphila DSM 44928]|uniref:Hydrolase, TatD family n=1 Tax=Catenulispora acidiphila (strain DSM 44928 / JCM 14897 / NBRC 102108 / NRRL B-24433 / ID139908) TaxID=479433 RepID=C7PYW8_CATAD|nr:TatD family hydrolase [Catenulispora acidiphila]ACU69524.1 hydrolase, TatD family [Catenulispora acidiphila DSM 44928]